MTSLERTGVPDDEGTPMVLSAGVVGSNIMNAPDLTFAFIDLQACIDRIRRLSQRDKDSGFWILLRASPATGSRTWVFRNGVVDPAILSESLAGIPETIDTVQLGAEPWAGLDLWAPSIHAFKGSPVRSLDAYVVTGPSIVDEAGDILLEWLQRHANTPGLLTGFVHADNLPDPYTKVVTEFSRLTDDDFSTQVHGYYWAVLLTGGHIDRLGGRQNTVQSAPCHRIYEIDLAENGPALLAILTDKPSAADETTYPEWRRFLTPLLRIGYPGPWEAVGTLKPLDKPVWVYEGAPVPNHVEALFARGVGRARPGLPVRWGDTITDPGLLRCWLKTGPGFDGGQDVKLIAAVVRAWYLTGWAGRLHEDDGKLHSCTDVGWDTDENQHRSLTWQFDPGSSDIENAIELLARALVSTAVTIEIGSGSDRPVLLELRVE